MLRTFIAPLGGLFLCMCFVALLSAGVTSYNGQHAASMPVAPSATDPVGSPPSELPASDGQEAASEADQAEKESPTYQLTPIGNVRHSDERDTVRLILDEAFEPALLGLDGFSHIQVLWWFDKNDTPQKRRILQVHPRGNRENPLTGVFATRSPVRPNLIALTLCKIVAIEGRTITVEKMDALDGTPILDIKPFLPGYDTPTDDQVRVPDWITRRRGEHADQ